MYIFYFGALIFCTTTSTPSDNSICRFRPGGEWIQKRILVLVTFHSKADQSVLSNQKPFEQL